MARQYPVCDLTQATSTPRVLPPQRMESVGKRRCSHDGRLAGYVFQLPESSSNRTRQQLPTVPFTDVGRDSSHQETVDDSSELTPSGVMRSLELDGVIRLLKMYDDASGPEIVCCICGKPYKSKVCFTKHVWEHSVYWDKFDGFKNHERVLSIQAAIILTHAEDLSFLLVTGPNIDKKQQREQSISPSTGSVNPLPSTESSPATPPQSSPSDSSGTISAMAPSVSSLMFLPKKRRRFEQEYRCAKENSAFAASHRRIES